MGIVRNQHLNMKKQLRFSTELSRLEQLTWTRKDKQVLLIMFKDTPLLNFSERTRANLWPSSQEREHLINSLSTA